MIKSLTVRMPSLASLPACRSPTPRTTVIGASRPGGSSGTAGVVGSGVGAAGEGGATEGGSLAIGAADIWSVPSLGAV